MPFITFLYIPSKSIGTEIIAETWYSFIFSAICLIPSQNAIAEPFEIGYKNPTVHSKTWCIGKIERSVSFSFTSTTDAMSIKFEQIFLWERATTLELDVVPDVNNIMLIFSLSILASINSLFPFFINFSPVFINSFKEYIPSVFSKLSNDIKCFNLLFGLYFILVNVSSYFLE